MPPPIPVPATLPQAGSVEERLEETRAANAALVSAVIRANEDTDETRVANAALVAAVIHANEDMDAATSVRDRLEALITGLSEGIIVLDGDGRVLLVNPALRRMLNLENKLIGERWRATTFTYARPDGSHLPRDERPILSAIRGESFSDVELLVSRDAQETRRCRFSANSVRDAKGNVTMAIVTVRDVTELRRLEQLRDAYHSMVSHDLRGPLAIILGAVERLEPLLRHLRDEEADELFDLVHESAERMNTMTDELMREASLESGIALELEPVSISSLAATVVGRFAGSGREIEFVASQEVPLIEGDQSLIEHALANLLTNAFKYSDRDSPITVRLEPEAADVKVSVQDRGRGIRPEAQPFIFDRFYRAREAQETGSTGYGLGLYMVRLIVESHGGRIWVQSEPGSGSTFMFTLPAGRREPVPH